MGGERGGHVAFGKRAGVGAHLAGGFGHDAGQFVRVLAVREGGKIPADEGKAGAVFSVWCRRSVISARVGVGRVWRRFTGPLQA